LLFFGAVVSGAIMLGLPFASVGADGATAAASPDAAVGGAVVDPAAIFESALGTPAGFGVAGLAELPAARRSSKQSRVLYWIA
jgi:hypothetical protein